MLGASLMPTPELTLERFAELSAELDAGAPRDEVLEAASLSGDEWSAAQEHWLAKMASEAARKRFELTNRYTKAFKARRETLAAPRAVVAPIAPSAAVAPTRASEPPPRVASAPPPPAVPELARGDGASPWAGGPRLAPGATEPTGPPFVAAKSAPPPFVTSEPAPPPRVASTTPLSAPSRASEVPPPLALPVVPTEPAPPPAPVRATIVDPGPPVDLGQTMAAISPFALGAPLPFRGAGAVKVPSSPPPAAAGGLPFRPSTGGSDAPPPRAHGRGETLLGDAPEAARGAALPFRAPDPATAQATSPAPAPAASSEGLPFQASAATLPVPARSPEADPPAPPPVARLPLARFAQMSAESQLWPSALPAIRARYGLDEAAHAAENEAWQRLFAADAALYARYGGLLAHYRDWLAKTAR
jgi:hypothetical protein